MNYICHTCKWASYNPYRCEHKCLLGGKVFADGECEAFEEYNKCENCVNIREVKLLGDKITHRCEINGYIDDNLLIKRTHCVDYKKKY